MHFVNLSLVTILLLMIWYSEAFKRNKVCYNAKICIHNGDEKCGMDNNGKARRFFDSCDMREYNCLFNSTFVKVKQERCKKLPPIEMKENKRTVSKSDKQ